MVHWYLGYCAGNGAFSKVPVLLQAEQLLRLPWFGSLFSTLQMSLEPLLKRSFPRGNTSLSWSPNIGKSASPSKSNDSAKLAPKFRVESPIAAPAAAKPNMILPATSLLTHFPQRVTVPKHFAVGHPFNGTPLTASLAYRSSEKEPVSQTIRRTALGCRWPSCPGPLRQESPDE